MRRIACANVGIVTWWPSWLSIPEVCVRKRGLQIWRSLCWPSCPSNCKGSCNSQGIARLISRRAGRVKSPNFANVPYIIYYTYQIYIYSRMRNIVLRAFWNWWRRNQFEISSWMCASNIPKFSFSEPHDNVGHPNSLFLPFGSFVSLLLLEPQALCQLPVVDNLLQMPDLQVLQAQYRWWVCLGPGLFRIDDGTWRLICRAQIRIWAFYLGMHTSVHNFIHMGGCDAERQGSASFISQQVMQRMSRTAISNAVVASKDVIFLAGAEAKAAYFTQHLARTNRWLHAFSVESAEICWTQVQKHSLSRACMCNTVCKECTQLLIGRGAGHWRIFTMPDKNQQLGNITRVSKA